MFALERQQVIANLAREHGRVDVSELASTFEVSTETVRRDLTILEQQHVLRRVHGGAVPIELAVSIPDLTQRTDIMAGAKRAIGLQARMQLPLSGTILIDSGTTTARLAAAIPPDHELTVITNAIPIAEQLARQSNLSVYLLGGRLRPETLATVDYWALEQLESLDVDVAFMGTNGVSPTRGFSTPDSFEATVKSAMVNCAKRVVVLADRTKLGQSYMSVFAPIHSVDVLITDSAAAPEALQALRKSGLNVELSRHTSHDSHEESTQISADA